MPASWGLVDFSFTNRVTPRIVKFVYVLATIGRMSEGVDRRLPSP